MELLFVLGIVVAIIAILYIHRKKDHHAVEAAPVAVEAPALVVEAAPVAVEAPAPVVEAITTPAPAPVVEAITTPAPAPVEQTAPKGKKSRKPHLTSDPRDANHDGVTSEEEKRAWALADARDTNHDGVISAEEKSVAKRNAKSARKPSSKKV
jgi:hypothetical protein